MRAQIIKEGEATVLALAGRMDAVTVERFESACREQMSEGVQRIVIDLEQLEYVSSAGLRGILTMEKESKTKGVQLVFCAMHGMVADMFDLTYFNSILTTSPSRREALG